VISFSRLFPATTGIVAMLAIFAMPGDVFSQPQLAASPTDTQLAIIETIQEIELRDGPNSADLVEPLTELGLHYEVEGDLGLATAAFARARGIVRVNYGFRSMEEAFVLQQLVRTEEAMGNVEAAWSLEQELLNLVWPAHDTRDSEEYPSDPRTVPILNEIAKRRTDVLDSYRAGEFPPQIVLGCYYDRERRESCSSGSRSRMMSALASEANWYRAAAIRAILVNKHYTSRELWELEIKLLGSGRSWSACPAMSVQELLEIELLGSCLDPIIVRRWFGTRADVGIANVGGEAALMRLLIYELRIGAPTLRQVNALVRLADWQIRFPFSHTSLSSRYRDSALALYEYAYQKLKGDPALQESIDTLFSPEPPLVLETFQLNPLAFAERPDFAGYIDVAFDITKYGRGQGIEILDTTTNVSRKKEREIIRLIGRSVFRPRLTAGQFVDSSRVVARYYLGE
jgi:hypothetical protein